MEYLNFDDIIDIHNTAIECNGGDAGSYPETESKIESILSQQYGYFGHDEYPTIYNKAAMLFYFFTKGHCFVDGNKRVGLGAMLYILDINGYSDMSEEDDWYELTLEVAISSYSGEDLRKYIQWISDFLKKRFIG